MRVGNSVNLLSNDVSAGLEIYKEEIVGDLSPTAWFCKKTFRWFKLLTSRSRLLALSQTNEEEFKQAKKELTEFKWIMTKLKFNQNSKALMPFQKAVLISTNSCLELSNYLLSIGYTFVLTSRVSTDCVENIFSQVRVRARKPSCLQFAQTLKSLAVTNFVSKIESSNYDHDETEKSYSIIDFLESKLSTTVPVSKSDEVFKHFRMEPINLSNIEKNHVYYFAGYLLQKIKKFKKISDCDYCTKNLIHSNTKIQRKNSYNNLTLLKNYKAKKSLLVFPTLPCFRYFCQMEKVVKNLKSQSLFKEAGCADFFLEQMLKEKFDPFQSCHGIKEKVITLFFKDRLRISLKQRNRNREQNPKLIY